MRARLGTAAGGLALLGAGMSPLVPYLSRHLADPAITVIHATTIRTYLREVFLQTDAVGPAATVLAWMGLTLLAVAIAWPTWVPRRTAREVEA